MATVTQHAPGTFCWPELSTTDPEAAKKFYSSLFGWEPEDNPMGEAGVYTLIKNRGRDVGALHAMHPGQLAQGVPPHWMNYVAVENADQAAKKAQELGATLLIEPFDVMDLGRMAAIQDPTGAVFCVWQAMKMPGAGVLNETGALCWTELISTNMKKAESFYTALLSWKAETKTTPMPYTIFSKSDGPAAGMMAMPPELMQKQVPSHWYPYFQVDDADAAVKKASALGAKVHMPPTDIPGTGRFAVLADPQGANFALIKIQS
jgi:predicted enzyme related to lactoylglutathione lyase